MLNIEKNPPELLDRFIKWLKEEYEHSLKINKIEENSHSGYCISIGYFEIGIFASKTDIITWIKGGLDEKKESELFELLKENKIFEIPPFDQYPKKMRNLCSKVFKRTIEDKDRTIHYFLREPRQLKGKRLYKGMMNYMIKPLFFARK